MTDTSTIGTHTVSLTEAAARSVGALMEADGRSNLRLRLGVRPGGCGVSYELYFDDQLRSDDLVNESYGIELVVDRVSAFYSAGARVDVSGAEGQQGFTIDNPNVRASAGGCCG